MARKVDIAERDGLTIVTVANIEVVIADEHVTLRERGKRVFRRRFAKDGRSVRPQALNTR